MSSTLVSRERLHLTASSMFSRYSSEIAERFCPYLLPADAHDVLWRSHINVAGDNLQDLQAEIFYQAVAATESLRHTRRTLGTSRGVLLCDNLTFDVPSQFKLQGEELLKWPHSMLKVFYTKVGIMFGKFWIGEDDIARNGERIPGPPINFISIRSAIPKKDVRFFEKKATQLKDTLIDAEDDGRNVHASMLRYKPEIDVSSVESMREHGYYAMVYGRFLDKLAEQGTSP